MRIRLVGSQPLHAPVIERAAAANHCAVFDATDLTFASPLDLTGVAAWAARLRYEGSLVAFAQPADGDVRRYLARMDLVAHLD